MPKMQCKLRKFDEDGNITDQKSVTMFLADKEKPAKLEICLSDFESVIIDRIEIKKFLEKVKS